MSSVHLSYLRNFLKAGCPGRCVRTHVLNNVSAKATCAFARAGVREFAGRFQYLVPGCRSQQWGRWTRLSGTTCELILALRGRVCEFYQCSWAGAVRLWIGVKIIRNIRVFAIHAIFSRRKPLSVRSIRSWQSWTWKKLPVLPGIGPYSFPLVALPDAVFGRFREFLWNARFEHKK